jgi:hypothetical protein
MKIVWRFFMRTKSIGAGLLAAVATVVLTAGVASAQDNRRITCEPIPPRDATSFELDLRRYPNGICPTGFVAVVNSAPAAISSSRRSASGD